MNSTTDPQLLIMFFVLPGFFGLSLVGEGVSKLMNYDNRGWIGIAIGSCFILLIIISYLVIATNIL